MLHARATLRLRQKNSMTLLSAYLSLAVFRQRTIYGKNDCTRNPCSQLWSVFDETLSTFAKPAMIVWGVLGCYLLVVVGLLLQLIAQYVGLRTIIAGRFNPQPAS